MENVVISGSDITFGLLEELFRQLKAGVKDPSKGLTGVQLRALLEHRNPFERAELEKVLPYADEQVPSNYGYPKGFHDRAAEDQISSLREFFPGLIFNEAVLQRFNEPVIEGAESKKIIPDYRLVAKQVKRDLNGMSEMEVYCMALNAVVEKLQKLHGYEFHKHEAHETTPKHSRCLFIFPPDTRRDLGGGQPVRKTLGRAFGSQRASPFCGK